MIAYTILGLSVTLSTKHAVILERHQFMNPTPSWERLCLFTLVPEVSNAQGWASHVCPAED